MTDNLKIDKTAAAKAAMALVADRIERQSSAAISEMAAIDKDGPTGDNTEHISFDFTDTGRADLFAETYSGIFYHVAAWGWTAWNGKTWDRGAAAQDAVNAAYKKMSYRMRGEALDFMRDYPDDPRGKAYFKLAELARNAKAVRDCLFLAEGNMRKDAAEYDANPYDLNTPGGIIDLRTGELRKHDPLALCTQITIIAPADKPAQKWLDFLNWVTCEDTTLKDYLQNVAGMAAIGAVSYEGLIMSYGTGMNGKSTFWNALQKVMGSYSTTIAPEILMANKNRIEIIGLASVKGKRLVLAAETEEGNRLSSSALKRLASTDEINARELYHEPISFKPSHTLVIFTNHLPRISSSDEGTWRRIMAVPFKQSRAAAEVIKDYASKLVEDCGGAILQWIIEGSGVFCTAGNDIPNIPQSVKDATAKYRAAEDWLQNFIDDCFQTGQGYAVKSSALNQAYEEWATENGEVKRRSNDIAAALEAKGYIKTESRDANYWEGLRIIPSLVEPSYRKSSM